MQSRFITTGTLKDQIEVVLAYELKEADFRLDLHVIPRRALNNELMEALTHEWVDGGEFAWPEGTETIFPDINADSILPENIKSEKTGEIRHKQNEWAVQLLTNKLWESYLIELEDLRKRSQELEGYDKLLFDDAKLYWERVLEHKKERNITQERLDKIKEDVNMIFEQLKTFRKTESAEFEKGSNTAREAIIERLNQIKAGADEKANFRGLHEDIKGLQNHYRNTRFLKSDENAVRKAFDDAFHYIGEQRNRFFNDKFETRITGLKDVISKMEKGLDRDRKDLDYFNNKAENPRIQSLELQLLKVRIRQLKETVTSKEDKLKDIQKTLDSVLKQAGRTGKPEKGPKEEQEVTAQNSSHKEEKAPAEKQIKMRKRHADDTHTEQPATDAPAVHEDTPAATHNDEAHTDSDAPVDEHQDTPAAESTPNPESLEQATEE